MSEATPGATSDTHGFTAEQWDLLLHGPLYMLAQVGGADAIIDAAEWSALLEAVGASAKADDELVQGVMAALAEEVRAGRLFDLSARAPVSVLQEIHALLAHWGTDAGASFRAALMEIGATIAESSGAQLTITYGLRGQAGGGWMLASGTSDVERAALEAAAHALGLVVLTQTTVTETVVTETVVTDAP